MEEDWTTGREVADLLADLGAEPRDKEMAENGRVLFAWRERQPTSPIRADLPHPEPLERYSDDARLK